MNEAEIKAAMHRARKLDALSNPDNPKYHGGKKVDTSKYARRKTPRTGQRHAALDKARAQGRIQPRPPGHPNYQPPKTGLGRKAEIKRGASPKIQPKGYYAEIKKPNLTPKWDHPAKGAVRSNRGTRAISNIKKGVDSARWSAGNLMYKASQTGAGKLLTKVAQSGAGRAASAAVSKVAAPLLVLQGAYDAARIGKAGYDAFSAGQSAKRNEADQSKRYGTVDAATRTRHANDRKRARVAKNNSNKLKTGYKLP
jgi:hypothetical protein